MHHDAHEYLLQLLAKIYPDIDNDCMFKNNKLGQHFVMIVITLQIITVYVFTGLCI